MYGVVLNRPTAGKGGGGREQHQRSLWHSLADKTIQTQRLPTLSSSLPPKAGYNEQSLRYGHGHGLLAEIAIRVTSRPLSAVTERRVPSLPKSVLRFTCSAFCRFSME